MKELSPKAEAVLNAVTFKRYDAPYFACPKSIDQIRADAAEVLKAAADQVVPDIDPSLLGGWKYAVTVAQQKLQIKVRAELIAIADELSPHHA